jgi:hypothetical protein
LAVGEVALVVLVVVEVNEVVLVIPRDLASAALAMASLRSVRELEVGVVVGGDGGGDMLVE